MKKAMITILLLTSFAYSECNDRNTNIRLNCLIKEANKLKTEELVLIKEQNRILKQQSMSIYGILKILKQR